MIIAWKSGLHQDYNTTQTKLIIINYEPLENLTNYKRNYITSLNKLQY